MSKANGTLGGEVILYESADGEVRLDVRLERDSVWLSQRQIAELLDTSTDNVGLHLKNVYAEGELDEEATAEDSSVVQPEGRRQVRRKVRLYNLDAILSVGYRVNSKRGTQFRIWATCTLKDHLVRGYTLNERRLREKGFGEIEQAAGLKRPDLSILSEEFLAEVRDLPQRNLAVELLQKLLKGEIKARSKRNVVQARSFAALLEQAVRKYQNRAIETAQVIEELIALAKDMRKASARGEALKLSEDELAFYDALEVNDSAVKVLGEPTLVNIARELVDAVKKNVTLDWTVRENVRTQLRVIVKRILRKPDKQEKATQTVLEQAEVLSGLWAVARGGTAAPSSLARDW